jgi:acetyl esterase/lipase
MQLMSKHLLLLAGLVVGVTVSTASAQETPSWAWAAGAQGLYQTLPNITYSVVDGHENKLTLYRRRDTGDEAQPTIIYLHGGGWTSGSKEASEMSIIPWLELGWNVVNVDYRLSGVAPAPAAIEDSLCALRWVAANAQHHNLDLSRVVVSGDSAGGQLALMVGMAEAGSEFDRNCELAAAPVRGGGDATPSTASASGPLPTVLAIVNWYGNADLADSLKRRGSMNWLRGVEDAAALAKRISPLSHVRAGLPPVVSIHGSADPQVPYNYSVRLTSALIEAGVPTKLITVPGAGHGGFNVEERVKIWTEMVPFLKDHGVL